MSAESEAPGRFRRDPAPFHWQGVDIAPPWPAEPLDASGHVALDDWFPPVINQGTVPLCTAAVVTALAAYFARRARQTIVRPSVLFNYRMARRLMGSPDRRGAHIDSSIVAWQRFGMPDEAAWPWTASSVDADPPADLAASAGCSSDVTSWRIRREEVVPSVYLDVLRAAIVAGLPVACEFPLYVSQFAAFETGVIPLPKEDERSLGRHIALLVGLDDARRHFRVRNSWGTEWGDRGYGTLPYAYVEQGLAGDSWLVAEDSWTISAGSRVESDSVAARPLPGGPNLG
ncbi:C1 family peptidase [Micromonospora sp. NPDC050417]|uniref:C1 family peptidase n=1 Tax=Micromonospora sp. NPDC050417 TaxID=3364280 RepID=UPI003796FB68